MSTNIVIDVDTGVDDALALLLATRSGLTLRAVTCVAGNAPLEQVVRNTCQVLRAAGAAHIPVAAGATRPLLAAPRPAPHVHGRSGLADLDLRRFTTAGTVAVKPVQAHAVELLRAEILASPTPVTVVALGPLTNIALLLRTYPDVAAHIQRLAVMGGTATVGNATPVAEFNIWHDPEAARICLGAGVPVTMYGLDVFYQVGLTAAQLQQLERADGPVPRLAGALLRHLATVHADEPRVAAHASGCLGDAGLVCALIEPAGLHTERFPITVAVADDLTRGQTLVNRRRSARRPSHPSVAPKPPPPIDLALDIDGGRYAGIFLHHMLEGARG